jgi:hypothetical protein
MDEVVELEKEIEAVKKLKAEFTMKEGQLHDKLVKFFKKKGLGDEFTAIAAFKAGMLADK